MDFFLAGDQRGVTRDLGYGGSPQATIGAYEYQGYTPSIIQAAYGITSLLNNNDNGAGQTIAIIDPGDDPALVDTGSANFSTSDLAIFDATMNLPDPPSFKVVGETGGTRPTFTSNNPAETGETTMDVEWAHAIAPAADIVLIELSSFADADITSALTQGVPAMGASVVSMSFGAPEFAEETGTASTSYDDADFTEPGVAFIASSGDNGVPPSYPSSSANVIAVGATNLLVNADSSWYNEGAWSNGIGISNATESGTTVTITTNQSVPGFAVNRLVSISGVTAPGYDGTFAIQSVTQYPSYTVFTYTDPLFNLPNSSGGTAACANYGGSGGGASDYEPQPAYQSAIPASTVGIAGASESGSTVTVIPANLFDLSQGETITISGASVSGYNGTYTITGVYGNAFTYTDANTGLASISGTPSNPVGTISTIAHTTPDVSFIGGVTGVDIYDTYSGGWLSSGGTSLSAPCWAGLMAIADQIRADNGESPLSSGTQALPILYSLYANSSAYARDFHDITIGANGTNAGTGYDLVTGLGTPVANQLIPDLADVAQLYYTAPSGTNHFTLSEDSGYLQLYDNGSLVDFQPANVTTSIVIKGGGALGDPADNSLTVDYSGGIFNIPISFDGGAGNGTHTVTVTGAPLTSLTYNATANEAGNFIVNGATADPIAFTDVTAVTDAATAGTVTVNVDPNNADAGTISTTFTKAAAGYSQATFSAGLPSLVFANPSTTLVMNGHAANDNITVTTLDPNFNSSLTINGLTGNDSVNLNASVTFAANANLTVDLTNAASPGANQINVGAGANLVLSGGGTVSLQASQDVFSPMVPPSRPPTATLSLKETSKQRQRPVALSGCRLPVPLTSPVPALPRCWAQEATARVGSMG